jgi:hypothetical protein
MADTAAGRTLAACEIDIESGEAGMGRFWRGFARLTTLVRCRAMFRPRQIGADRQTEPGHSAL